MNVKFGTPTQKGTGLLRSLVGKIRIWDYIMVVRQGGVQGSRANNASPDPGVLAPRV